MPLVTSHIRKISPSCLQVIIFAAKCATIHIIYPISNLTCPIQYSVTITNSKLTKIFVLPPSYYFTFSKYCTLSQAANSSRSTAECVISVSVYRFGSHLRRSRVIQTAIVPPKVILKFKPQFVTTGHVVNI